MHQHKWYSAQTLKQIIGRAAELDDRADVTLSEADVRAIAADLSISTDAVARAIAEADAPPLPDSGRRLGEYGRLAATTCLAGLATGLLSSSWLNLIGDAGYQIIGWSSFYMLLAVTAITAAKMKGKWQLIRFQAINLATWGAMGLGALPAVWGFDHASWGAIGGSIIGAVVLTIRDAGVRWRLRGRNMPVEAVDRVSSKSWRDHFTLRIRQGPGTRGHSSLALRDMPAITSRCASFHG
jgi:hypothetical protein